MSFVQRGFRRKERTSVIELIRVVALKVREEKQLKKVITLLSNVRCKTQNYVGRCKMGMITDDATTATRDT